MQSRKDIPIIPDPKPVTRIDFGDHYPDGGWGWAVLIAATIVYILAHGFHFAFGTLYLEILDKPLNTSQVDGGWYCLPVFVSAFMSAFLICYVMLCYVMLCYVMLCYVMLCYVMLC